MIPRLLPFCLLLAVLLFHAPSNLFAGEDMFLPENPLEGRSLFVSKSCIKCHSVQGVGGKTGPDLGEIQLGSFSNITSNLWNHFPRMREAFEAEAIAWPNFTTEEAQTLTTFLYFLNYFDKESNADVGQRLFHVKSCVQCHSVGGVGGDIGPALDPFQVKYAPPFITTALWNSGPEMMRRMKKRNIPRPQFQERDVVDILAYIRVNGSSEQTRREYLPSPNPVEGKRLFDEKSCSACHAVRGNGGKIGPDLGEKFLKGTMSYILSQMWNHGSNMWPRMETEGIEFPKFEPEEMSNLMAYLYFIKFNDLPGNNENGKRLFAEKSCKTCHMPDDPNVKPIGPNLAEAGLENPFKVLAEMWNHAPAIEERMKEEGIRWPLLKTDEMRDLLEYILSLNESR